MAENECREFLENASDEPTLGGSAHLSRCANCREKSRLILELKALGTPFKATAAQKASQERIIARLTAEASQTSGAERIRASAWWVRWIAAVAVAVLVFHVFPVERAFDALMPHRESVLSPQLGSRLALTEPGARFRPMSTTEVEVLQSCEVVIREDGFELLRGTAAVRVIPGTPCRVETPHGFIRVTGTEFRVAVQNRGTFVEVMSGRVELHSATAPVVVLTAGEKGEMAASGAIPPKGISLPDSTQETPR